jgi:hypothetical protein
MDLPGIDFVSHTAIFQLTKSEHVRSPRKLMFQYKVAIWECNKSAWHEASLLDNQGRHLGSRIAQPRISPWKPLSLTEFPDISLYIELVCGYVTRKLTYSSDGLHAITGLLSLLSPSFPGGFISGLPEIFFDAALLWQPAEVMQQRRAPSLAESPPSWSVCTLSLCCPLKPLSLVAEGRSIHRHGS